EVQGEIHRFSLPRARRPCPAGRAATRRRTASYGHEDAGDPNPVTARFVMRVTGRGVTGRGGPVSCVWHLSWVWHRRERRAGAREQARSGSGGSGDERRQRADHAHRRAAGSWRFHGRRHRGVPCPPQPAVHRRLRDARLGRRRGGRPAGDLVAVGRRRPRHHPGPAGVPGPDHHPPGTAAAAAAAPPPGVARRTLATGRDRRAYLGRISARQARLRLRTLRRRKASYVGPWLPEPLLTSPDVADDVELADSVSMAMLLVLETLKPTERAVFVLREVF